MKREEYYLKCQRTCPDLGSHQSNILHMMSGVKTEFGELLDIYKKELAYKKEIDKANLTEELADVSWYMFNMVRFLNSDTNTELFNTLEKDFEPLKPMILETFEVPYIDKAPMISIVLATITTLEQRIFSIPVLNYENEESKLMNEIYSSGILSSIFIWEEFMKFLGVNPEEAYERNINKLMVRFPDKFTEEAALNRDLGAERLTLE